jgi:hypothetical protein
LGSPLARSAVLLLALAASCADRASPPQEPSPAAVLTPAAREVLGPALALNVRTSGCAKVASIRVRDGTSVIASAAPGQASVDFAIPRSAIDWRLGPFSFDLDGEGRPWLYRCDLVRLPGMQAVVP